MTFWDYLCFYAILEVMEIFCSILVYMRFGLFCCDIATILEMLIILLRNFDEKYYMHILEFNDVTT